MPLMERRGADVRSASQTETEGKRFLAFDRESTRVWARRAESVRHSGTFTE